MAITIRKKTVTKDTKASRLEQLYVDAWKKYPPEKLVGYLRGVLVVERRIGNVNTEKDASLLYKIALQNSPYYY